MSIQFTNLSFAFDPLGERLFDDLTFTISAPRTGIVGRNGSGKSTLLKLIDQTLAPTSGSVSSGGRVARLRQDLLQSQDDTVADLLGVSPKLEALRAIEAGSIAEAHFDAICDDWDIEARAEAVIAKHVPSLALDDVLPRPATTLSGGELVQLTLAALELEGATVALLDEPTNNLDRRSRAALHAAVESWSGQVVVVSHDVALLNRMDAIVEIYDGAVRTFGGNFDAYRAQLATEAAAAEQTVRSAAQKLRQEQRERQHVQTAMARKEQVGKKWAANKRAAPIAMHAWAEKSEKSRAGEQKRAAAKVEEARERLSAAEGRVRDDDTIRIPEIDPGIARGRRLVELPGSNRDLVMQGGDRW
ncbi:MAG: ABC-F family ATP-binding cassette domain-containing protein, partial [Propionibacterium sp.]|nr:ABC-F family ATP-binding cassette domain-containing protein [Propionibacterium sp.]